MDLHVIGPLASPAERAAVDAVLGPPESGWVGGPRDSRHRRACRARRPRDAVPPLPAPAGTPRRPVADRLDQHAGPQLRLQAAGRRAGRGLRRRHLLRPLRHEPATAGRGPRLRRHRLPAGRRGGAVRGPDAGRRAGRRTEHATAARRGCAARASACATARRRRCSRRPARPPTRSRSHPSTRSASSAALEADRAPRAGTPSGRADAARSPGPSARLLRPDRRRRPDLARRLPGARRLRGPGPRARDRPGCRHRGGHRLEADGPRRRRVPDRSQVGRRRRPSPPSRTTSSATPTSRSPGTFKDRVLLEGDPFATVEAMTIAAFATGASKGYLYIRGEYPEAEARVASGHRGGARGRPPRRRHPRLGLRLRHRAPARRRRLHLRRGDGALRVDRGQARRAAQQAAVPGRGRPVRQADGRQQRRDAGQRAAHRARRRRGVRPDRHRRLDRAEALLPVGPRRAAGRLRGRVRGDAARPDRAGRRRAGRPGDPDDPARWRGGRLRRARARSTCRSPSRRPGPPARRSARA